MEKKLFSRGLRPLLFVGLFLIVAIYFYFFIFLDQSWSLNNDYGWYWDWHQNHYSFWQKFIDLNRDEMGSGRFHPFYDLYIVSLYSFAPLTPLAFRICQILLLSVACFVFTNTLQLLAFESIQILFGELLFLGNLTVKDWITLPAAFEPVAIVCFLCAINAYLRNKKWISVLFFCFCFLSKETFFVLLPTFLILEYFLVRKKNIKFLERDRILVLSVFAIATLVFFTFIASLPRVYTAGKFAALPLKRILIGFLMPPLKAFAPAMILGAVALISRKMRGYSPGEKIALVVGASIVILQTLILAAWGPFDSWIYLHMLIPLGWAFILAALWSPLKMEISPILNFLFVVAVVGYLVLLTANGSRHVYYDFADARAAADVACQDFSHNPKIKIYCNCEEGSVELQYYLKTSLACPRVPEIVWTGSPAAKDIPQSNFEFLFSPRCNGPVIGAAGTASHEVNLKFWKVSKYF